MRSGLCRVLFLMIGASIVSGPLLAGQNSKPKQLDNSELFSRVQFPAWGISMREDVTAKEYWITWQDRTSLEDVPAAWHAPNRYQNLRSYFTPTGVRVVPRTTTRRPDWTWGLSLIRYGRGALSHPVEQAKLLPDENRIRLDRRIIEEWFVNEPSGLKHGFVLHAPPDSDPLSLPGTGAVHLDLVLSGSLLPTLEIGGRSIRFTGPSGVGTIYYRGLEAQDATDRPLPAWMELQIDSGVWVVRLLVQDVEATYPVTIDPVATTAAWTGELNQANACYGCSIGIAGDVDGDGYADVVVGAAKYDNGDVNEGAAFLYLGSSDGPSATHDWMVEGNYDRAFAGFPIGGAGDVNGDGYDDVILGAPGFDNGGGAWVFHGSPTGLSAAPDWEGHSTQPSNSGFGRSAGTAGDVNGDGFADVIVAAEAFGGYQPGRVYVYHGSESGLSTLPAWVTTGDQAYANYGKSVGTAGDVNGDGYDDVIVSAWEYTNGEFSEGRVYVYHGSAAGLAMVADWIFENNDERACLGRSVATAGDVNGDGYDDVIVGAPYNACWDYPSSPEGRAYVFHGSASGLTDTPDRVLRLVQKGAIFGKQVATAGDVNRDGYDDVLVSAGYYDNDQVDEGAAFLFLGSETGLTIEPAWMVEGNQDGAELAWVAGAGDVNGDNVDDVIIGASKYSNGQEDEGAAFLYLGTGATVAAGEVPANVPLQLGLAGGLTLGLSWGPSCLTTDTDYEVYEGQIGDFTSHKPRLCSTGGQTSVDFIPDWGSTYYLVVPRSQSSEGSYGKTSAGEERPPGQPACLIQAIAGC